MQFTIMIETIYCLKQKLNILANCIPLNEKGSSQQTLSKKANKCISQNTEFIL